MAFTESIVEQAALAWLERLGWTVKHGPEIAPGELAAVVQACLAGSSAEEIRRQRYSGKLGNDA
ncbi:MAG: hypothetical protein ACRERE_19285 [Candidatus Entotheonellia bacterium]